MSATCANRAMWKFARPSRPSDRNRNEKGPAIAGPFFAVYLNVQAAQSWSIAGMATVLKPPST